MLKLLAASSAAPFILPGRLFGADAPSENHSGCTASVGKAAVISTLFSARTIAAWWLSAAWTRDTHEAIGTTTAPPESGPQGLQGLSRAVARKDIDAVRISTLGPDHWHSIPAIATPTRAKTSFCEKPLSHTFAEGIAMVDAVQKNKRIWQTGSGSAATGSSHGLPS